MYVETPGRYEVRAFFFSDRNGSDDQAPAPLYRQFNILTTSSSPLRSNMSSANRGAGPSRGGNKRTRDDADLPSSAAHPPSSRMFDAAKENNKQ
jgi:hypothetical protein